VKFVDYIEVFFMLHVQFLYDKSWSIRHSLIWAACLLS